MLHRMGKASSENHPNGADAASGNKGELEIRPESMKPKKNLVLSCAARLLAVLPWGETNAAVAFTGSDLVPDGDVGSGTRLLSSTLDGLGLIACLRRRLLGLSNHFAPVPGRKR